MAGMDDPEVQEAWITYLNRFRETIWPVLQKAGFTNFEMGFLAWMLNRTVNALEYLEERERKIEKNEEDEGWRGNAG